MLHILYTLLVLAEITESSETARTVVCFSLRPELELSSDQGALKTQVDLLCETLDELEVIAGQSLIALLHFQARFSQNHIRSVVENAVFPYATDRNLTADLLNLVDNVNELSLRVGEEEADYKSLFAEISSNLHLIHPFETAQPDRLREAVMSYRNSKELIASKASRTSEMTRLIDGYQSYGKLLEQKYSTVQVEYLSFLLERMKADYTEGSLTALVKAAAGLKKYKDEIQAISLEHMSPGNKLKEDYNEFFAQVDAEIQKTVKQAMEDTAQVLPYLDRVLADPSKETFAKICTQVDEALHTMRLLKDYIKEDIQHQIVELTTAQISLKRKLLSLKAASTNVQTFLRSSRSQLDEIILQIYDSSQRVGEEVLAQIELALIKVKTDENAVLFKHELDSIESLMSQALQAQELANRFRTKVAQYVKRTNSLMRALSKPNALDHIDPAKEQLMANEALLRKFPAGRLIELQNRLRGLLFQFDPAEKRKARTQGEPVGITPQLTRIPVSTFTKVLKTGIIWSALVVIAVLCSLFLFWWCK